VGRTRRAEQHGSGFLAVDTAPFAALAWTVFIPVLLLRTTAAVADTPSLDSIA